MQLHDITAYREWFDRCCIMPGTNKHSVSPTDGSISITPLVYDLPAPAGGKYSMSSHQYFI